MTQIFVFGSNLAGIHGAGSARHAYDHHGAVWGIGVGLRGNSYAIPTKNHNIETMPLAEIEPYVKEFLNFARQNENMTFKIVAIGCGLAGFTPEKIAPMFKDAPENCVLPMEFMEILNDAR